MFDALTRRQLNQLEARLIAAHWQISSYPGYETMAIEFSQLIKMCNETRLSRI